MSFIHVRGRAHFWTILIVIGILAVCGLQPGQAARQPETAHDSSIKRAQPQRPRRLRRRRFPRCTAL
jgi:hypothetical protein